MNPQLAGTAESTDPKTVLNALSRDAARELLGHLDEPRTARELAGRSDVPISTVYRTLERLVDAGLVRTRTEISFDGHHRDRYELIVDSITISLDDELDVSLAESNSRSFNENSLSTLAHTAMTGDNFSDR